MKERSRIMRLRIGNRALQSTRQIDMEERSIQALHYSHLGPILVRLAICDLASEFVFLAGAIFRRLCLDFCHLWFGFEVAFDVVVCVRVVV